LIDRKYPQETRKRKEAYDKIRKDALEKKKRENKSEYKKIPIYRSKLNIFPGMVINITLAGRPGTDFFHLISRQKYDPVTAEPERGNRKFVMMKSHSDTQGFLIQFKALVSRVPVQGNFNTSIEI